MNMIQNNVRQGPFQIVAAVSLVGKEGRLAVVTNAAGVAKADLPAANSDHAYYLIVDGVAAGSLAVVAPLESGKAIRVRIVGAANPGDVAVLADVATAANKGAVRALPATAGTYRGLGIVEEVAVDDQLALVRPAAIGNITVSA